MYLVRCNQLKFDGSSCMTTFPHANIKHEGPCVHCCNALVAIGRTETLKGELVYSARKANEQA